MATRTTDPSRDASRDVSAETTAETTVMFHRVAETAARLKHRVSLVATLPAVRRLRNFLNPCSRLPACDKDMVLLGERYERTKRSENEDKDERKDEDGDAAFAAVAADPGLAAFLLDLRSRVWITYRRGFPPIASGADGIGGTEDAVSVAYQYTTDAGWGCTLRVGQMLLANALSFHFFGRGYRRRKTGPGAPVGAGTPGDANAHDLHDRLVSWFGDDPDADACPFSIHQVYRWGRGELDSDAKKNLPGSGGVPGVVPGRWLGPCVTAQAMAALTNARRPGELCAYVLAGEDGTFGGGVPNLDARDVAAFAREHARRRSSERRAALRLSGAPFDAARAPDAVAASEHREDTCRNPEHPDWAPTLVLVPLVLGVDRVIDERYVPSVVATLRVKQSLGVLGGKPGASLYFVGAQGDRLFYLDPHTVFPFRTRVSRLNEGDTNASTHACDDALHVDARELDPSMVLGFYCRTRGDLDELCLELELLQRRARAAPLVTVSSAAKTRGASDDRGDRAGPAAAALRQTSAAPRAPGPGSAPPEAETEAGVAVSEDDEWELL